MEDRFLQAIRKETEIAWGITKSNGFTYDPEGFWLSLQKRMNDLPLSDDELSNYMRGYIVCTILEINMRWPQRENEGKNDFQKSILSMVVSDLMEFYEKDPQRFFFNYLPNRPKTDNEKRHLHRHIKGKARLQIKTALETVVAEERDPALKPRKVKKKKQEGLWMDTSEDEYISPQSISINDEITHEDGISSFEIPDERYLADIELTEMDEVVLANQGDSYNSSYNQAQLKNDVSAFFNDFYLKNRKDVHRITPFFTNISFYNIRTKDIWTANKLEWKALEVWNLLVKIDERLELAQVEKEILYHFYLVICLSAMKQKKDDSVIPASSEAPQRIVISKPVADILYLLIVKTFLYFTFDLEKKVFSRVIDPPPESESDISKFSNAIKDKPREMLKKTVKIPANIFPPASPATKKKMTTVDEIFSENFNLHELFESYEVFEYLTEKVRKAFETGKLDDEDSVKLKGLKAFLSDNNIEISTIFNFLNPISQKEDQDYDYIIQGAISAITTGIMSQFKKEDGKLQIILTKDENSLNSDMLAKATAEFTKSMIEKDFDIKRGDVSALANTAIGNYLEETDTPFMVSIPEGSEYDSFRMMVDMNGPIKVAIPFATQGDKPFWDDEKVLDDKMVQMIDKSITDKLNAAKLGKTIAKFL